jgi:hypothetical protein
MSLSTACFTSTDSALYLVHGQRLWDAEIVLRSVLEGSLKWIYLLESEATFTARCLEYCDALPAIAQLKWHARAAAALKCHADPGAGELRPYRDLLLTDEEAARIRAAYPRQTRRALEDRWGFTSLLKTLSRVGGAIGPIGNTLLHTYSVASHLQHMSNEGTEMLIERDRRKSERRDTIHVAHAAGLIDHCFYYGLLRLGALHRFFKNVNVVAPLMSKHDSWTGELWEAGSIWRDVEYGRTSAA